MRRKLNAAPVCILPLLLFSVASVAAPSRNYPLAGKVLEANAGRAHVHTYKVETDTSIYKLLCYRHPLVIALYIECSVNGKPLEPGDEVHLRTDGKTIFLDAGKNKEQTLSILLEETKVLPPLPMPAGATEEGAVVLARGLELDEQSVSQSGPPAPPPAVTSSAPTTPAGPVLAVPVTGGPPVPVTASGPVSGGIVNGVSATGQPVTGVVISPVSSPSPDPPPLNRASTISSGPAWVSILYLQTDSRIYKIQCAAVSCVRHQPDLGDPLIVRTEGKWAYVSSISANNKSKESKFRILSVSGTDEPPSSQPF